MGPALTELIIGDDGSAWERAGFAVVDGCVTIDSVRIRLQSPGEGGRRGVLAWAFDRVDEHRVDEHRVDEHRVDEHRAIDGMPTLDRPGNHDDDDPVHHPNGVTGIDHIVVMTDDLDRTSAALRASGFEPRRRRAIPKSDPPRSQIFWWAGPVIIELVGPDAARGNGPASIWGLALTTPDLDATGELLGEAMSTPRDAVQEGRRIAGIRGKELGLSVPLALMTPHV